MTQPVNEFEDESAIDSAPVVDDEDVTHFADDEDDNPEDHVGDELSDDEINASFEDGDE